MIYVNAFLFCGIVCVIGQLILDNTKLTPGHITSMFVVLGALLDTFSLYDKIILWAGGGAMVPIPSFGHLLIQFLYIYQIYHQDMHIQRHYYNIIVH